MAVPTTEQAPPTNDPVPVVIPDHMDGEDPAAVDPDLAELEAAKADVATEEGAAPPVAGDPPAAPPTTAAAPPATPAAEPPAPAGDQAMVPHAVFHAKNEELKTTRDQLRFREGQLEAALRAPAPAATDTPAADAPPAAPPTEQLLKDAEARFLEETGKFDAGEITATELEQSRFRHAAERDEINRAAEEHRQQQAAATQPPAMSTDEMVKVLVKGVQTQVGMDAHVIQLQQDHPYLMALSQQDTDALKHMAIQASQQTDKPILLDESPEMTVRLREDIAALADRYGPVWYPGFDPAKTQPPSPSAGAPPAQPGALSDTAAARLKGLEAAAAHPPDTSTVGSQGGHVEVTDQQIESMTEDEVAALPASVKQRLLQ